jgi:hypothetical protein
MGSFVGCQIPEGTDPPFPVTHQSLFSGLPTKRLVIASPAYPVSPH